MAHPPLCAYLLHPDERLVAVLSADRRSGALRHRFHVATGRAPIALAQSADERWLVSLNAGSNDVTLFQVSPKTGLPRTRFASLPLPGVPIAGAFAQQTLLVSCDIPQPTLRLVHVEGDPRGSAVDMRIAKSTEVPHTLLPIPGEASWIGLEVGGGISRYSFSGGRLERVDRVDHTGRTLRAALDESGQFLVVVDAKSDRIELHALEPGRAPKLIQELDTFAFAGHAPSLVSVGDFDADGTPVAVGCPTTGVVLHLVLDREAKRLVYSGRSPLATDVSDLSFAPQQSALIATLHGAGELRELPIRRSPGSSAPPRLRTRAHPTKLLLARGLRPESAASQRLHAGMGAHAAVRSYRIDQESGALSSIRTARVPLAVSPASLTLHPQLDLAFVSDRTTGELSVLPIDPDDGALGSVPVDQEWMSSELLGTTLDPSGRFLYCVSSGRPGDLSSFAVAFDGSLFRLRTKQCGNEPLAPRIDPTGRFLYLPQRGDHSVAQFAIDPTNGELTEIAAPLATAHDEPVDIAIDPYGGYALVLHSTGWITSHPIHSTTGRLGPPRSSRRTGKRPVSLAIHPSGLFAYVANRGSSSLSCFRLNPERGTLLSPRRSTVPVRARPTSLCFDVTGRFLYASHGTPVDQIASFLVREDGRLVPSGMYAAGSHPIGLTVSDRSPDKASNSSQHPAPALHPPGGAQTVVPSARSGASSSSSKRPR